MVNPILLIAVPLAAAFLLPLVGRVSRQAASVVFVLTMLFNAALSVLLLYRAVSGSEAVVFTAGFAPPLSISLRFGILESAVIASATLAALGSGILLVKEFGRSGPRGMMLLLALLVGVTGITATRDLFNLFVFMEVTALALYGLIPLKGDRGAFQAGFKYIIAGGIASVLYLIGTIFIYRSFGSLDIDLIAEAAPAASSALGVIPGLAAFFLAAALLIELKPFPANGWALDVYQAAPGRIGALISGTAAAALIFGAYKITPLLPSTVLTTLGGAGLVSFLFSNLLALKQRSVRRMLGYSSSGYIGLVLFLITFGWGGGYTDVVFVAGGLLLTHVFIKAGLFWFTEAISSGDATVDEWRGRLKGYLPKVTLGILIFALAGMPPFPGFFAKYRFVITAWGAGAYPYIAVILLGFLFEAVYLFRFLGAAVQAGPGAVDTQPESGPVIPAAEAHPRGSILLPLIAGIIVLAGGVLAALRYSGLPPVQLLPIAAAALFFLIDRLPLKIKGAAAVLVVAAVAYYFFPAATGLRRFFLLIFAGGGIIQAFAGMYRKGDRRCGYYPAFMITVVALMGLTAAETSLGFLTAWELMALGGYLLVIRGGSKGETPALTYLTFSAGGAFLLMTGLAASGSYPFSGGFRFVSVLPAILLAAAFLAKAGAAGLHVWLPGAYAETEDDGSSLLSAVVSKGPVFALLLLGAGLIGAGFTSGYSIVLGWIGVVTAFTGTFLAVFEEDVKRLLAYSSMGQIGYIILAVSLADHFGWTTALYLTLNHVIFKGMLFLAAAGIIYRTGTRLMYRMGGLIKRMPVTFLSVLMAIIALSGVPPLSGFGSKWLAYNALLERGWYFQLAVIMFTSTIAFLYLFRLIHAMFLGQPKPEHRNLKEAPLWLLIPQILLMVLLMAFSARPQWFLKPMQEWVVQFYPETLVWQGSTLKSALGYWSGELVMYVTMGVFGIVFIWLVLVMRRPQHVKQFNVVFAAERPDKPSTTHFAYNFFAPYKKALGFLLKPAAEGFWRWSTGVVDAAGSSFRRIYTGNGQTYALHIILYVGVLYLITGGLIW